MSDRTHHAPSSQRTRVRIGWAIVAVAAAVVIASFLVPTSDDAGANKARGPRAVPVAATPVEIATITERRRYPGELDADTADVASFYPGRVKAVHVRVGDTVVAGKPLAEIDPIDAKEQIARARAQARAAAADQRRAKIELAEARTQLTRFEELRDQVSDAEFDAQRARVEALGAAVSSADARQAELTAGLRLLEKRVVESVIRAPFAGRIAARHVDPGAIVAAGAPVLRVVATAPLRVRFEVPEQEVAGLAVGTTLQVVTQAGTADGVAAQVTGVGAEVDRDRRIAILEAVIDAPPAGWLPGMYAEAIVDRRTIPNATVVPAPAVQSRLQPDGEIAVGVLIAAGEVARWVPVTVVARQDERVAIEAADGALPADARVLVAGHVDLSDGSRIQIAEDDPAPESP